MRGRPSYLAPAFPDFAALIRATGCGAPLPERLPADRPAVAGLLWLL